MRKHGKTLAEEGLIFGVLAGIFFMMMELIVAAITDTPAIRSVQMFASIVLGRSAFATTTDDVVFLGAFVHLGLSALYGLLYALVISLTPRGTTKNYAREALIGVGFGLALWLFHDQLLGRVGYPWFLAISQPAQALMYTLFFGLPLGLMFAAGEREVGDVEALTEQTT